MRINFQIYANRVDSVGYEISVIEPLEGHR
jgi:hypothetical protein